MKNLIALLSLLFATSAFADKPVLSHTAYGAIQFGNTLEQTEKLLKEKATEVADADERLCRELSFRAYPGVTFMVEQGVITRAESGLPVLTAFGVTVGAPMDTVRKIAAPVVIKTHPYDPDGHYLIFKSLDGKAAIVMEEGDGKITAVRGGLLPSAEYIEGCL